MRDGICHLAGVCKRKGQVPIILEVDLEKEKHLLYWTPYRIVLYWSRYCWKMANGEGMNSTKVCIGMKLETKEVLTSAQGRRRSAQSEGSQGA